jgi:hypothetical protein
MAEEIHPYSKELDDPVDRRDEDESVSDFAPDAGTERFSLFGRIIGLVITIIVNSVIFVVINHYYDHIPFLTDEFSRWLPYANASIAASILLQFLLFFIYDSVFKPLAEAGSALVSLVSIIALLGIFPFDFDVITWPGPAEDLVRVVLFVLILVMVIVIVANIAGFFGKLLKRD